MDEDLEAKCAPLVRALARAMVEVMNELTKGSVPLEAVMELHERVIEKHIADEDDRQTLRNIFEQAARERLSQ
jgi:hypothetical protein